MNRFFSKISEMREVIYLVAALAVYCIFVYFLRLPCPIYFVTGISCPGCGMTRALFALLRCDFKMAVYYHPLIFVCVLAFLGLIFAHLKKKKNVKRIVVAVFVILLLVTYLYRLLILKSPILHFTPENGIFVRLITLCFN